MNCLIFNPVARGEKARRFRAHLDALSGQCVFRPTAGAGDARLLAAQAVREGFNTLIAAGGDGTVNEVLNGMGDVPGGFARARLGVMPLGTANAFAREIQMPLDWGRAAQVLWRGNETAIDLPVAEFLAGGKVERRYFIQLAGAGLDARAIELLDWELKKKIGPFAYIAAGLKAMRERHSLIQVEAGGPASGELVLLGNGRFYGGNLVLFPRASLQDGVLEVCVFPKINWLRVAQAGLGLLTGRLHKLCSALQLRSSQVKLTSAGRVLLELDGETVGQLPATVSLIPKGLRIVVP